MSKSGIWFLGDRLFEAVVTHRNDGRLNAQLPELGGLPCVLEWADLTWADNFRERLDRLQPEFKVEVKLHLHYDDEAGYGHKLIGSEVEADVQDIRDRLRKDGTVLVQGRVTHLLHHSVGVTITTERYGGLRGVVHRINMPGRDPAEQRRNADSMRIGQVVYCSVKGVQEFACSTWPLLLSLGEVSAPNIKDDYRCGNAKLKDGWIDEERVFEAVVDKNSGKGRLQVEFKTNSFSYPTGLQHSYNMVAHLPARRALGTSTDRKRQRANKLQQGDRISVRVRLRKHGEGIRLQATETRDSLMSHIDAAMVKEPVSVNARITKKHKKTLWVDVTSEPFDAFRAIVRIDDTGTTEGIAQQELVNNLEVGDSIAASIAQLNKSHAARFPLILTLKQGEAV